MYQCEDQDVPCHENDYYRFDDVCRRELALVASVDEMINRSKYCQCLALDLIGQSKDDEFLNLNDHLSGLKGKFGLYHLWIEVGNCQDHQKHSLLCIYVGKGHVKCRVLDHIKTKWPETEMLYITFYECENRAAKYLEQLFLDTYNFHLNTEENTGSGSLYARWEEERIIHGTEIQAMSKIYEKKFM